MTLRLLSPVPPLERAGRAAFIWGAWWAISAFIPPATIAASGGDEIRSRAASAPRKVVVATALARLSGDVAARLEQGGRLIDEAAQLALSRNPAHGVDLVVLPEYAIQHEATDARARSVELTGPILATLGAKAREHHTWMIVPMMLREDPAGDRCSNAAVLFDRAGKVGGIYRKVHPVIDASGRLESGVTPGTDYCVFACDFGRVGILICWDMSYESAWDALGADNAEIVAVPSASPQTVRPMAQAMRHRYYVVTSTPRNNVSIFDPIGQTIAQATGPGVLVQEIDLAYAVLHFYPGLREGRAFTERFGAKVGYRYSAREDTGVFWSNDASRPIGTMVRELGFPEMPAWIEQNRARQDEARSATRR
jgi:predicted amidohydrolase